MSVDDRDPQLRQLISAAADNDATIHPARLRTRVANSHRTRPASGRTVQLAIAGMILLVGLPALIFWLRGGEAADPGQVELAVQPDGLIAASAAALNPPDLPPLEDGQRAVEPRLIPENARRCSGPEERDDGILVTSYCHEQGLLLELWRGSHEALPETGSPLPVADRVGYYDVAAGRPQVTVSDDNSLDDTHFRLVLWSGDVSPAAMAAVLASIPDVADAPADPADS